MPTMQTVATPIGPPSPVVPTSQGYALDRLYEQSTIRLRVQIRRDAYDTQSSYRVSAWDGTAWREVAAVLPHDPQATAMPSYVAWQGRQGACEAAVERMADRLLAMAGAVLS